MLTPMFETVSTDGIMGGGQAEGMYRSMMVEEFGKSIVKNGGIGIADNVYREILKMQEG
jgi:Rod binding domain-containing protein